MTPTVYEPLSLRGPALEAYAAQQVTEAEESRRALDLYRQEQIDALKAAFRRAFGVNVEPTGPEVEVDGLAFSVTCGHLYVFLPVTCGHLGEFYVPDLVALGKVLAGGEKGYCGECECNRTVVREQ